MLLEVEKMPCVDEQKPCVELVRQTKETRQKYTIADIFLSRKFQAMFLKKVQIKGMFFKRISLKRPKKSLDLFCC